jgi:hypothetical protein
MKTLLLALLTSCVAQSGYTTQQATVTAINSSDFTVCGKVCTTYPLEVYVYNNEGKLELGQRVVVYDCTDTMTDHCGIYELGLQTVPAVVAK